MRILHVVPYLPPASGITTFIVECSDELQRSGGKQTIVVEDMKHFAVAESSVGVPRINVSEGLKQLKAGDWNVIHMHGIWPPFMHGFVKEAVQRSIPIVWSLHGMLAPWALKFKRWKKLPAWYLWQKRDLVKASVLHATTDMEAMWIRDRGFKNRIEVIPLGTRLPPATSLMNEFGASHGKTLLFVGRINPVKALDNLLKAWEKVKTCLESRDWCLRIVGTDEGCYRESLERLVESLHIKDSVTFVGPKYGEQLDEEYRHAYGLVLPSHSENFGGVIIDALVRGVPVIVSNKTPWADVERHGCGWWVDNTPAELARSIHFLMSLPWDKRMILTQRGLQFVSENYTWESVSIKLKELYDSMLQQ